MKDKIVPILVVGALIGGLFIIISGDGGKNTAAIKVRVPTLTTAAKAGEPVFNKNCSQCHGRNAAGTKQGPTLIHKYYEPNHHGDGAFYRAAAKGVQAHHWRFGNMPPVKTVKRDDVSKIITYVRELQRANGIN